MTLLQALWQQGFLNGQGQTPLSIPVGPVEVEGKVLPGFAIVWHRPSEQGLKHLLCSTLARGKGGLFHISQPPEIHSRSTSPKAGPCKGQPGVVSERKKQNAKVEVVPVRVRKTFPS